MNDKGSPKDMIQMLEQAAEELDLSRQHMLVAAEHMRNKQIPRFGAHVLAANGRLATAMNLRDQISQMHASHANPTAE